MSREMALFKDFWSDVPSVFDYHNELFKGFPDDLTKMMNAKCDYEELDDKYKIELEVPGIRKNEIEIILNDELLKISWSHKRENRRGFMKKSKYERREGSFSRSFHVTGADPDKISAELKDGILKVEILKKDDYKPRQIKIN